MSARNGRFDLFEKPADGTSEEQRLLATDQDKTPLDWSSDGRFLLYVSIHPKTGSDLWALPLHAAQSTPFPVVESSFEELQGQFSPDGRWLAYASNQSGQHEIYVKSFVGSGATSRVSAAGVLQPRWARDGRELFYVAPDGTLMAVPVQFASRRGR